MSLGSWFQLIFWIESRSDLEGVLLKSSFCLCDYSRAIREYRENRNIYGDRLKTFY